MSSACPSCQRELRVPPDCDARFCMFCGAELNGHAVCDTTRTIPPQSPRPAGPLSSAGRPNVPGYDIVRLIGAGAMGQVYEGVELETGRRVALKCLNRGLRDSPGANARFLREAQLPARISHPHVTFVYGAFQHQDRLYIVMELMAGQSLETVIREQGPLPPEKAVDFIVDVVDGLDAAHRQSVIHRDVKPSNCFLHTDGTVKVGDFGLSKSLVDHDVELSMHSGVVGTLAYASPEQVQGGTVDQRADVYAVGATLFHLLTGRPPFEGDALVVCSQIVQDLPPSVREFNSAVPRDLARIVQRCLAKDPALRFHNMVSLRAALLPFSSYGTRRANLSRRLAAFMIDYFAIVLAFKILLFLSMAVVALSARQAVNPAGMEPLVNRIFLAISVAGWLTATAYFAIGDGRGGTLGKRFLGLRVVNRQGESPGWFPGLIRAIALPGGFGLTLVWPFYQATVHAGQMDAPYQVLSNFSSMFVYLVPTLLVLATMTRANQYRGLHEFMSGTRVIGVSSPRLVDDQFPVNPPLVFSIKEEVLGPYHTQSILAHAEHHTVYLAHDMKLNREVWIMIGAQRLAPCAARVSLSRVSRPRWLGGGTTPDGRRWDAFEAVEGVPLQILMGSNYRVDWRILHSALEDFAAELLAALDDGTLSEDIHLANFWVDRRGHGRILDEAFSQPIPGDPFQVPPTREEKYWRLFRDAFDLAARHSEVPLSVRSLLKEVHSKSANRESLAWVVDQLHALGGRTQVLTKENRAGVMGVTLGFEWVAYSLFSGLFFMAAFFMLNCSFWWQFLTAMGAALLLVGAVSLVFPGGFAFWFMQVAVCDKRGRPAPLWLCVLRSMVAWAPAFYMHGLVLIGWIMLFDIIHGVNMEMLARASSVGASERMSLTVEILHYPWLLWYLVASFVLVGVLLLYGIVHAVWLSPQRGFTDVVIGTRLIPN